MRGWWVVAVSAALSAGTVAAEEDGKHLFRRHCAICHGIAGRGDGPDAELFEPPPRDLREGFLRQYSSEALVDRVREGTPLALVFDRKALHRHADEVEALAAYLERLPTIDWRRVERGEELWVGRCELCHGPSGKPPPGVPHGVRARPPDLSSPAFQERAREHSLTAAVLHQVAGMTPLPDQVLSVHDTRALEAFVRLFSPGFEIYGRYCAGCHGDDGRPVAEFNESPKRPTAVFDRRYFETHDQEAARLRVWHMLAEQKPAMPHLARELTVPEARAIVRYLQALP